MHNSVIICDKILDSDTKLSPKHDDEETKTIPINFNKKKGTCKTQNFIILLIFSLITIVLLMAVSTYYYFIKYWAKQLIPIHHRNNELREGFINMSIKIKDTDIKIRAYYFFNEFISTKKISTINIKIDINPYRNTLIYYIGYVTMKEYVKSFSVTPWYLIFRYVN